jgi:hypothetical protein
MWLQQHAMTYPAARRAIGLPDGWPHDMPTPVRTGTHPLAKYLGDANPSEVATANEAKNSQFLSIWGLRQPGPAPAPAGPPPADVRAVLQSLKASETATVASTSAPRQLT